MMIIKLLNQPIQLVKIADDEYKELDGEKNIGMALYAKNKIVINNEQSFEVLLHEITHFWVHRAGIREIESLGKESVCDLVGALINNLTLENGVDIIKQLKEFAEQ